MGFARPLPSVVAGSFYPRYSHPCIADAILPRAIQRRKAQRRALRESVCDDLDSGRRAALLFALSFFVVSIACDYRYMYFLDLAAMTGAIRFFSPTPKQLA